MPIKNESTPPIKPHISDCSAMLASVAVERTTKRRITKTSAATDKPTRGATIATRRMHRRSSPPPLGFIIRCTFAELERRRVCARAKRDTRRRHATRLLCDSEGKIHSLLLLMIVRHGFTQETSRVHYKMLYGVGGVRRLSQIDGSACCRLVVR